MKCFFVFIRYYFVYSEVVFVVVLVLVVWWKGCLVLGKCFDICGLVFLFIKWEFFEWFFLVGLGE